MQPTGKNTATKRVLLATALATISLAASTARGVTADGGTITNYKLS